MGKKSKARRRQMMKELLKDGPKIAYPKPSEVVPEHPTGVYGSNTATQHIGHNTSVCHRGPVHVMNIGNVMVYAGALREVRGDFDWDFILRLTDGEILTGSPPPMFNKRARELLPPELEIVKHDPAIVDVTWPDWGVPELSSEWWHKLNETIKTWEKGTMLIHCVGGHGRTGTALAIFAALNKYHLRVKSLDPVAFVRLRYCSDAVETLGQNAYITEVTGVRVLAQPRGYSRYNSLYTSPATNNKSYSVGWDGKEIVDPWDASLSHSAWDPNAPIDNPGDAWTIRLSQLKAPVEARWHDDGHDYIWAGDKLYEDVGEDRLLEIDWTEGSYMGLSEHRKSSGGM